MYVAKQWSLRIAGDVCLHSDFLQSSEKEVTVHYWRSNCIKFLYSGPMLSVLGVKKTTAVQEIAGVPSQQIARAYFAGKISDQEREEVQKFYDFSATDYDTEEILRSIQNIH